MYFTVGGGRMVGQKSRFRRNKKRLLTGSKGKLCKKSSPLFQSKLLVFVFAAAAAGILFSKQTTGIIESLPKLAGENAAIGEIFLSLGRAVGGEGSLEDSLQNVYESVFSTEEVPAQDQESNLTEETGQDTADIDISIVPELPENASLEYRILGFRYTSPVAGLLTSSFGWRMRPGEGETTFHYGIDLAAAEGTEIVAFADGEVFAAGESSTLGKYIILHHADGYSTLYAHCSEILVTGGAVTVGQPIARVGDTGAATGAHLHFELQDGSVYLNPVYYVAIW